MSRLTTGTVGSYTSSYNEPPQRSNFPDVRGEDYTAKRASYDMNGEPVKDYVDSMEYAFNHMRSNIERHMKSLGIEIDDGKQIINGVTVRPTPNIKL